jgi:hypothetical protein
MSTNRGRSTGTTAKRDGGSGSVDDGESATKELAPLPRHRTGKATKLLPELDTGTHWGCVRM